MAMPVKTLAAQVAMTRSQDGLFRLSVIDDASRIPIIELALDEKQFADLLSSRVTGDTVPVSLRQSDKFGWRREWKIAVQRIVVLEALIPALRYGADLLREANPGWEVEVPEAFTHHRAKRVSDARGVVYDYQYRLTRWVAPGDQG